MKNESRLTVLLIGCVVTIVILSMRLQMLSHQPAGVPERPSESPKQATNALVIVETHHDNGELASCTETVAGRRNGTSVHYAEDGLITSVETYRNGKRHGACVYFLADGKIKHGGYWKDDRPYDATYTQYRGTNLWQSSTFRRGQKDGFWKVWYEDGREDIVRFTNGLKNGLSQEFGANGHLQCERDYVNGVEMKRRCFDSSGKLDAELTIEYRVPGKTRLRTTWSRNGVPFTIHQYGPDGKMTNSLVLRDGTWGNEPR